MNHPSGTMHAEKIPIVPGGATLYERLGGRPGVTTLVKWFYAQVRFDDLLQPIFDAHIPVWAKHLEVLIDFWAQKMGGPPLYNGSVLGRHLSLNLGPEHYAAWLRIWEINARWLLSEPESEEIIALAHRIAAELEAGRE